MTWDWTQVSQTIGEHSILWVLKYLLLGLHITHNVLVV